MLTWSILSWKLFAYLSQVYPVSISTTGRQGAAWIPGERPTDEEINTYCCRSTQICEFYRANEWSRNKQVTVHKSPCLPTNGYIWTCMQCVISIWTIWMFCLHCGGQCILGLKAKRIHSLLCNKSLGTTQMPCPSTKHSPVNYQSACNLNTIPAIKLTLLLPNTDTSILSWSI